MNGQVIGKRAIRTNWAVRRPNDEEKKAHTYEQIYNAATSDNTTVYIGNIIPTITGNNSRRNTRSTFRGYVKRHVWETRQDQGSPIVRIAKLCLRYFRN